MQKILGCKLFFSSYSHALCAFIKLWRGYIFLYSLIEQPSSIQNGV